MVASPRYVKSCSRCGQEKPYSSFGKKGKKSDGTTRYQAYCKECRRVYFAGYYRRHKKAIVARVAINNRRRRDSLYGAKRKPCADCGGSFPPWVMDFDHRSKTEKLECVSFLVQRGMASALVRQEMAKCDVVCANCHRQRTHDRSTKARLNNK